MIFYVLLFTGTTSLIGFKTGLLVYGLVLGILLGGWYGYLRATKTIGLGPVWLLFVMATGALLAPAIDGDGPEVAIMLGIFYGWVGFLSETLTKYLFVAVAGFAIGGVIAGTAGCIVGAIVAICFVRSLHLPGVRTPDSHRKHESEQRVADEALDQPL